ncbi:hypothetical protein GCM10009830_20800 [Glycomyces endophyticus]|uniref:YbaB/EbfC family DNA-binding protein n=1 Tax=Glycomyces endophyticus TaxID=480996 RepID=A0ABN2GNL2_9ACTN
MTDPLRSLADLTSLVDRAAAVADRVNAGGGVPPVPILACEGAVRVTAVPPGYVRIEFLDARCFQLGPEALGTAVTRACSEALVRLRQSIDAAAALDTSAVPGEFAAISERARDSFASVLDTVKRLQRSDGR